MWAIIRSVVDECLRAVTMETPFICNAPRLVPDALRCVPAATECALFAACHLFVFVCRWIASVVLAPSSRFPVTDFPTSYRRAQGKTWRHATQRSVFRSWCVRALVDLSSIRGLLRLSAFYTAQSSVVGAIESLEAETWWADCGWSTSVEHRTCSFFIDYTQAAWCLMLQTESIHIVLLRRLKCSGSEISKSNCYYCCRLTAPRST